MSVHAAVRRTLSNGLRAIVMPLPHLHGVSQALLVRAGPRFETPETSGLSHLVEHLLFRGTRKLPSSFEFNSAMEALGGEVNGLTQRDATTIHATLPPEMAGQGLALLGDLCTRPLLTGLDVERDVVIEEILDTTGGNGVELDVDTISRSILWAGHPIGMPVAGTLENVKSFREADCRKHWRRTFVAKNGVLCVAGPVDAEEILAIAERAFGKLPRGRTLADGPAPRIKTGLPIHVQDNDDSQVSVLLSFPGPGENHPDFVPLLMLRRVLDDGLASRLRQAICEQRGLAYSVSASIDVYADVGAIDLEAACSPSKLVPTVAQMLETLRGMIEGGVGKDELARVKVRHQAELGFALDDASEMCGWYGATELVGCKVTYQQRIREAMAVTPADLKRVSRELFRLDRALLTLVGPVETKESLVLETLLRRKAGSTIWLNAEDEGTPLRAVS